MAKLIFSAIIFLALATTTATAGTVYKWVDGTRTVYSQTPPPPGVKFEIVEEKRASVDTAGATARTESYGDVVSDGQKRRDAEKMERERIAESNKIKEENCQIAKDNLASLTSRGQVTIKEGDLYRKLTEEERQERIKTAEQGVTEFCD